MRLGLLAFFLAAGCDQILGVGPVHEAPDAGSLAGGTLHATSSITWIHADGTTVDAPEDLSAYTVRALVHDATGFQTVQGSGTADGQLTVPNLPAGEVYLELTRPGSASRSLYRVDRTELDAGFVTLGHPGATTTTTTPIHVSLDQLTPWALGDGLHAASFGAGTDLDDQAAQSFWNGLPAAGATSVSGAQIDWAIGRMGDPGATAPRLVDQAKHDDVWIAHLSSVKANDGQGTAQTFGVIEDAVELFPATMADGQTATWSGTVTPVAQSRLENVTFDGTFALLNDPGANGNLRASCALYANPGALHDLPLGIPLWSTGVAISTTAAQVSVQNVPFGSPFPAGWSEVVRCDFVRVAFIKLPGIGQAMIAMHHFLDTANAPVITISPRMPPPAAPTVGGVAFDAGGLLQPGQIVHMTWAPVTAAAQYQVTVRRYVIQNGRANVATTATIDTTTTSIDLPADLLQPDAYYVFSVWSIGATGGGGLSAGQLRRTMGLSEKTQALSHRFFVSATCGNHTVDPGEDCDDGGESATCNVDCSSSACGDGILDKAAGEECDDSNLIDGDGCDPTCHKE